MRTFKTTFTQPNTFKKLFVIGLFLISLIGFSQEKKGKDITVTIENIKNNRGHVIIGLHTEDTFMKSGGVQKVSEKISDNKMVVTFKDVQPGNYAILALHDENDNQRMDFEPNGMPLEYYAVSNNPVVMGPPIFNDGKFEVGQENVEVVLKF